MQHECCFALQAHAKQVDEQPSLCTMICLRKVCSCTVTCAAVRHVLQFILRTCLVLL